MNTAAKKAKFLIEIRKQEFDDYLTNMRRQRRLNRPPFDAVAFEEKLKSLYSNKMDEARVLVELTAIQKMSDCEDFYIEDRLVTKDLVFFIEEIVAKYRDNVDIILRLTYLLIDLFYQKNFRNAAGADLMITLNLFTSHNNKQVISNLLNIIRNLSVDEVGANLVLKKFELKNLSPFITNNEYSDFVAIEHYPYIGYNLAKIVGHMNYQFVS